MVSSDGGLGDKSIYTKMHGEIRLASNPLCLTYVVPDAFSTIQIDPRIVGFDLEQSSKTCQIQLVANKTK